MGNFTILSHQVFCSYGVSNLKTSFSISWEYIAIKNVFKCR